MYIYIYIEIDLALFLKDPLHQFIANNERLLRKNNPKCITKYKTYLVKDMQQHDLFYRGYIIQTKINNNTISQLYIKELNGINESINIGCLNVEYSLKTVQASHP